MVSSLSNRKRLRIGREDGRRLFSGFYRILYRCSGRSGIRQILASYNTPGTVFLPTFGPEGVVSPFLEAGWEVKFYPITREFQIDFSHKKEPASGAGTSCIFVVIHLCGTMSAFQRDKVKEHFGATEVWEDFSHYLPLRIHLSGEVGFCSLPKLFDVADGCAFFSNYHPLKMTLEKKYRLRDAIYKVSGLVSLLLVALGSRSSLARLLDSAQNRYMSPYKFLRGAYEGFGGMSAASILLLSRVDLDGLTRSISRARNRYQELRNFCYVSGDRSLPEHISFGVPIFVKDKEKTLNELSRSGIQAASLVSGWDHRHLMQSNSLKENSGFFLEHLIILPHRYLSSQQLDKVVGTIKTTND